MDKRIYSLIIASLFALGIALIFVFFGGKNSTTPKNSADNFTKEQVKREDAYYKGKKGAKVEIVEFADFQCPACKMAAPTMDEVVKAYGDKVIFYYRYFPLPQHEFGLISAEAAEASGIQGKFWEMHDLIFANQSSLTEASFSAFAKNLGLNPTKFESDRKSEAVSSKVNGDKSAGEELGVNSTPTFFVNGEKVEGGGLTLDDWKKIIDKKLSQ